MSAKVILEQLTLRFKITVSDRLACVSLYEKLMLLIRGSSGAEGIWVFSGMTMLHNKGFPEEGGQLEVSNIAVNDKELFRATIVRLCHELGIQLNPEIELTGEHTEQPVWLAGWHQVVTGFELYRCVLAVLKKEQGEPVLIDQILADETILTWCYTPKFYMIRCKPPNIRRARKCIMGAISNLRSKGHLIESSRMYGQIAYTWLDKG